MLDLGIFIFLVIGFLVGLKRGFIMQLVHLLGFVAAFIVAAVYYDDLAPKLKLWVPYPQLDGNQGLAFISDAMNLEEAYYRAIAFMLLFFAVRIIMQIIGSMLDFLAMLPVLKQLNIWAGGVLGFLEVYIFIFLLLYIGTLVPIEPLQSAITDSVLAGPIVEHTPFFSGKIKDLWISYVS